MVFGNDERDQSIRDSILRPGILVHDPSDQESKEEGTKITSRCGSINDFQSLLNATPELSRRHSPVFPIPLAEKVIAMRITRRSSETRHRSSVADGYGIETMRARVIAVVTEN